MTLMLKPELSPVNAPMLTLVAALAGSADREDDRQTGGHQMAE